MEPSPPYLVELTLRLATGVEHLPERQRQQHRDFFLSSQQPDGGFCGRSNASDLYYTAFALRGLVLLGTENDPMAQRCADYLRSQLHKKVSVIDLLSLVFAARLLESSTGIPIFTLASTKWPSAVAQLFEQLRRPDGGYAKSTEGHASSTYQTFLIALAYELLELPLPDPQTAADFILNQQREDGGFVEIAVMRRSGTNPTAAAIGALRVLQSLTNQNPLTPKLQQTVAQFLMKNTTDEGGLRANTQIPIADLLSTYTGLQTVRDLGAWSQVDTAATKKYVDTVRQPTGGYLAAPWDETPDVEYTFYGVALEGLLREPVSHK